jgi:hypothetical protein
VVVARDGTDVEGEIKVAISQSGVAYIAWLKVDGPGAMILTARAKHVDGFELVRAEVAHK